MSKDELSSAALAQISTEVAARVLADLQSARPEIFGSPEGEDRPCSAVFNCGGDYGCRVAFSCENFSCGGKFKDG